MVNICLYHERSKWPLFNVLNLICSIKKFYLFELHKWNIWCMSFRRGTMLIDFHEVFCTQIANELKSRLLYVFFLNRIAQTTHFMVNYRNIPRPAQIFQLGPCSAVSQRWRIWAHQRCKSRNKNYISTQSLCLSSMAQHQHCTSQTQSYHMRASIGGGSERFGNVISLPSNFETKNMESGWLTQLDVEICSVNRYGCSFCVIQLLNGFLSQTSLQKLGMKYWLEK